MNRTFLILLCATWVFWGCASRNVEKTPLPIKIILDTDIGPDYDDVGAVAVLHAIADSGKAEILAILASNKDSLVVPTIEVLNHYFGRPTIPVGAPKTGGASMSASQHWPDSIVAKYPHQIRSTAEAPDAVTQYRKILTAQTDGSVTIVTVGFLTNLSNLLQSPADQISSLTGTELVARKVKKLVSMAGWFPKGREFNVFIDSTASKYCFEQWPTPIIFSGFEIGEKVKTGLKLIGSSIQNSPVKDAFRIAIAASHEDRNGRMSWDQTAVLIALYGTDPFFTTVNGTIKVNPNGSNSFDENPEGRHQYVKMIMNPDSLAGFIEKRMMHLPVKKDE